MMVDFSVPEVRELIGKLIETYRINGTIYHGRQPFPLKNRDKVVYALDVLQKAGAFKYYITDADKNIIVISDIKDTEQQLFIQFKCYSNQIMEKLCGDQLLEAHTLELTNSIKTFCNSSTKNNTLLVRGSYSLDEQEKADPDVKQFYDATFDYDGGNICITIDNSRYHFPLSGGNPEKIISLACRFQDEEKGIWRDKLAEIMHQPNLKSLNTVFKDNVLVHTILAPFIEITANKIRIQKSIKLTYEQARAIEKRAR